MSTEANNNGSSSLPGGLAIISDYDHDEIDTLMPMEGATAPSSSRYAIMTSHPNSQDANLEVVAQNALDTHSTFQEYCGTHSFRPLANYQLSCALKPLDLCASQSCPGTPVQDTMRLALEELSNQKKKHIRTTSVSAQETTLTNYNFAPIYLVENPSSSIKPLTKSDDDDVFVTEAMIQDINDHIGRKGDSRKIELALSKMRRLGGLDPLQDGESLDIPRARLGLCYLAQLDDKNCKVESLKSMQSILQNDRGEEEFADQLVTLTIKFTEQLDRSLMQAKTVDVQILFAKVYNQLIDSIRIHYEKKHYNAITKELKEKLTSTAKAFRMLNRQENTALKYYIRSAGEGSLFLTSDAKDLFEMLKFLYEFSEAATSFYMHDAQESFAHVETMLHKLETCHFKSSWYKATLSLKTLAMKAENDLASLVALLILIQQERSSLDWRFSYSAVLILKELCLNSSDPQIRLFAFQGMAVGPEKKQLQLPGLKAFVSSSELAKYRSWGPVARLEKPKTVDPNPRIQEVARESIREIVDNTPDAKIRTEAERLLDDLEDILEAPKVKPTKHAGRAAAAVAMVDEVTSTDDEM